MSDVQSFDGMKALVLDDGRVASWRSIGNVIHLRIFDPKDFGFQ